MQVLSPYKASDSAFVAIHAVMSGLHRLKPRPAKYLLQHMYKLLMDIIFRSWHNYVLAVLLILSILLYCCLCADGTNSRIDSKYDSRYRCT